jgi:AAA15 family ATPase/GTPase
MFRSIKIENFRGFKHFELQQLGRINLLVGLNNSGKTSILEAVQLLCSRTNLEPLTEIMLNRGEYFRNDDELRGNRYDSHLDIRHLFFGHEIQSKSRFSISCVNGKLRERLIGAIEPYPIKKNYSKLTQESPEQLAFIDPESEDINLPRFIIIWEQSKPQEKRTSSFQVLSNGGLPLFSGRLESVAFSSSGRSPSKESLKSESFRTQFISSSSLNIDKAAELFDQIVLTPNEDLVEEALQIIEPEIERIALVRSERTRLSTNNRGGFIIRLRDSDQRIPIGSMGDGVWRILTLALAIVCAKGGVLLVDEIDTGLHFSTMSKMWKLIWETARKLDVQVFATTHNSDCWTSLAMIAEEAENTEDEISIQRIERDKGKAVAFSKQEIVIAAERGIEVR